MVRWENCVVFDFVRDTSHESIIDEQYEQWRLVMRELVNTALSPEKNMNWISCDFYLNASTILDVGITIEISTSISEWLFASV